MKRPKCRLKVEPLLIFQQKSTFAAGLVFQMGVLLMKDIEYRVD